MTYYIVNRKNAELHFFQFFSNFFLQSMQKRAAQVQYSISRTQDGFVEIVVVDFEDGEIIQLIF